MTTYGVSSPTSIHFTIDERHGTLEAKHIAKALQIPFEPIDPSAFRQWSPLSQRDMVHILSRGTSTDSILLRKKLPPRMLLVNVVLQSFYFGPYHFIMASLVYFEEKVHRKKLQRADIIPLLFLRLHCQILAHMCFPTEPQHECRRLCRKRFTLDKWN
ncbi:hypothetical protein CK203_051767 [Vitis vinifera]|uniref:Uncharacterized protein n=1 Tax=Vitis vinifera TaxID=29760 RepID=A0A438HGK7_VITVI|nr:hypothetical protein CK203_051767 [Vitis vinifera]